MKFCIDIQSAITQRAGVGRYTREIAQHIATVAPDDDFLLPYFDFKGKAQPFDVANATLRPIRWCPGRVAQLLWKNIHWPPYNWFAGNADLYHFPNFIIPPIGKNKKTVVTIHDMSFVPYPHFAEGRNVRYLNAHIKNTVARADAIITVSKFSATEICTYLGVPEDRVFAIYHGISDSFARPNDQTVCDVLKQVKLDHPYLLTVGTIEPRKNLPLMVDIFEKLEDFDGELVIAGGLGWKYEPILERIRKSPRADSIKLLGYTSDEQLPALYAGARAFIVTSHYEGFGFPPVEAMACSTPVISSTGGSLAEILGEGACIVNSLAADDWMEPLNKVLNDSDFRDGLIERGLKKAAEYRWSEAAKQTIEVYRQVAG